MAEVYTVTGVGVTAVNMAAAVIVALVGAAVMAYERFSLAGRRLALLTTVLSLVLVCIGLTALAPAGGPLDLWFHLRLALNALLAPAIYGVAVELVGVRRPRVVRAAWAAGVALSAFALAWPGMVDAVRAVGRQQYLADGAWVGTTLVLFMLLLILATLLELVRSYRTAADAESRRRAIVLTAGFAAGGLGMLDFFLVPLRFAGVGVTPFVVTTAVLIIGFAAVRFRAFAPLPTIAAERILQVMGDGVLLCDAAGRLCNANRAACQFLGMSEGELAGTPVSLLFREPLPDPLAASESARVTELDLAPGRRAAIRDRELLLVRADGSTLDVSVSSEPLLQKHAVVGSVIVFRDVGERLRATRMLRATEQRYHSLFWNNPALVYEIDADGMVVLANPATQRALEAGPTGGADGSFRALIHPNDSDRANDVFARVLAGEEVEYRLQLARRDGTSMEIKGVSVPVLRDGAAVGVFGVAIDISEEERVRRALERQRLEFAELFESSPEAILIADENDVVVRVNPEFTRTFGYTSADAVGRQVEALIVPPDRGAEGLQLTASARQGETVRAEVVRQRKDGSLVEVSVLARELKLPGGATQLFGIYRDLTDQRRAERSLRERDEELRHSQRLEAVGKLAGGVAHDFNNLVTVINGHLAFALEALPADHPVRCELDEIERAGTRAANLTQQLLAFSRRQVMRLETVDASAVIGDVRRMLDRIIGEHIRFETAHHGDARVRADRGQLEQLLVNLVVNARDAMPAGGRLTIATEPARLSGGEPDTDGWNVKPGPYVCITVADTGTGMDAATAARAFDPFFTTKERGKGTGLGLATVFGIVKQSGGHVTLASVPGAGTTVQVWLPADIGSVDSGDVVAPTAAPAARSEPASQGRILLVEDETALRELSARVLRRAGHDVLLAEDGEEGLRIARENRLDLVVSDLVMPRMGGRELVRQLGRFRPELPVLLMTGYDDEIATGGTGEPILAKPFTPAELARRVDQALRVTRN